jgi:acetyl-CoA carboxylase biotin carboxylase subunit
MFSRILIANRGEIALRIIRACRELGIETVVVYSQADRDAQYLKLADYAVCIGPAPSSESYLNIPRIISAAEITDVQAIHPGCGFLAENAHFAEVCESSNIRFIGPPPKVISLCGNKSAAVRVAKDCKIPTVPGSDKILESPEEAIAAAKKLGYPVIIKAAAGGGGKGMRVVHNDITLRNAFFLAQREAEAAFKDKSVYIEKYIEGARHIEVQILCDDEGERLHLGLRDCSLQRRHQKLIEESPPPGLPRSVAESICKAALKYAEAVKYVNAGTVEFLVDRRGRFYFMEINARLQVEHPVTEMVTGVDLLYQQIRIASGEKLRLKQSHIEPEGVAIECRINAEDPDNGFKPSPGTLKFYHPPGGPGVRLDTHVYTGYTVSPFYDPLIGKLIVYGRNRSEAIAIMRRALDEFVIEGVKTTIPLYRAIFGNTQFVQGGVDTGFIESLFASGAVT